METITEPEVKYLCKIALKKLKTPEDIDNFMDSMFALKMIDLSMPEVGRLKDRRYDLVAESKMLASSHND